MFREGLASKDAENVASKDAKKATKKLTHIDFANLFFGRRECLSEINQNSVIKIVTSTKVSLTETQNQFSLEGIVEKRREWNFSNLGCIFFIKVNLKFDNDKVFIAHEKLVESS